MKINIPSDAPDWVTELVRNVELAIAAPAEGSVRLKGLATADLPDPATAAHIYGMVYDKTLGAPSFSDGADWKSLAAAEDVPAYAEGTWTPTLRFGGGTTGMTATSGGRYTKIGRMVFLNGWVALSAKGSSTGTATIAGLPFTSANTSGSGASGSLVCADGTMASLAEASAVFLGSNTAILGIVNGAATGSPSMTHSNFTNTSSIWFSIAYFV